MVAIGEQLLGTRHNEQRKEAWQACTTVSRRGNVASTDKQEASARALMGEGSEDAVKLAGSADELLATVLSPGKIPSQRAVRGFLASDALERVLSLYSQAMLLDPEEPTHAWNLAVQLDRLGLHDLALIYLSRAINQAEAFGDEEGADAHALLALADVAIRASQLDLAELTLERARRLNPSIPIERYVRRLRRARPAFPAELTSEKENRDSARKGKAVEHLIAASVMLASDLQLNVSTSFVDDEGVDLVFHRRESPTTLAVQVKSRSWQTSQMTKRQTFVAQIRAETFRPRRDLYLLAVAVDGRFADYGPVWLVPSESLAAKLQPNSRNRLRFVASARPSSHDMWSDYKLERSQLSRALLRELGKLEPDLG